MPSEKSQATASAPVAVKVSVEVPVPAARSSTRSPGLAPAIRATVRRHSLTWPRDKMSFSRS